MGNYNIMTCDIDTWVEIMVLKEVFLHDISYQEILFLFRDNFHPVADHFFVFLKKQETNGLTLFQVSHCGNTFFQNYA